MSIGLLTIPVDLLDPGTYVEYDNSRATGPLPPFPRRVLLIGQRLPTGQVAALVPTRIFGPSDGIGAFGRGSMLAAMITAARTANDASEMWAIALDDAAGSTAAAWTVTAAGTAPSNGTSTLYIGGVAVPVAVGPTVTANQAAQGLAAAINANGDLPVTALVDANIQAQVNVTCRWKGASGGDLDLRTSYYDGDLPPSGFSLAIAQTATGSANPSLVPAIASLGNLGYSDWAVPYYDGASQSAVSAELERRGGSTVQKDAMAYTLIPGTVGQLAAIGSGLDEKFLCNTGAYRMPSAPWVASATIAAVASYYLAIDPAAPLDTLVLPGLLPPAKQDEFQHQDRETLLHDGIGVLTTQGQQVTIKRLVTSYRINAQGITDRSYLNVETMATLAYLRYWLRARIAQKWSRYKLANDGKALPKGQRVTCPRLIKLDLVAGANDLFTAGIIDDVDQFSKELLVERDGTNRDRVNAVLPYTLIGQFRQFAGQVQFRK